jgi:heat shock protein HslJ
MLVLKKKISYAACGLLVAGLVSFGTAIAGVTAGRPAADVEDITVRSSHFPSGAVTLRNGEYREFVAPGSATEMVVKLTDKRAFGKVDGREAAAVVIITDPGGSGTFADLALLIWGPEGWVNADTVLLGDRVKVHAVSIREDEIFVNMKTHGPGDALCCPSQEKMMLFRVKADHLIAQDEGKKDGAGEKDIIGPTWQWVRTRYDDATTLTRPADAAGYTIEMKQDGTIQVRGDCNLEGGSFTVNGRKLTITIAYSTMAACPEGSLEDQFIRDLNRTRGYILRNGLLNLDLQSGTMEFSKVRKNTP